MKLAIQVTKVRVFIIDIVKLDAPSGTIIDLVHLDAPPDTKIRQNQTKIMNEFFKT